MQESGRQGTGKRWGKRPGLFVDNSRFYILCFTVLASIIILTYFRTTIQSDTLYLIRVQQVYGFMALLCWYLALLATPLGSIFGKRGFMRQYLYARRALGVSAAYFATLHMLLGLFGQLGGPGNIWLLPDRFRLALIFGLIGLLVLLLMAATSFDKVVAWLTFPRWKWLHRVGYAAAIFVFLHVWMIGTHVGYAWLRWTVFIALMLLAGLESWRATLNIHKKVKDLNRPELLLLFISLLVCSAVLIVALPRTVGRYHAAHEASHGGHE